VSMLCSLHVLLPTSPLISWLTASGGGSSVTIGTGASGVRGLLATRDSEVGDVLLEVPLSCCLSDFGATDAAIEPPAFAVDLPWATQLACSVLARLHGDFESSWPEAPDLPFSAAESDVACACDAEFAARVAEQRKECNEQYELACKAAGSALGSSDAFDAAISLVWSRALLIRAPRPIGLRRLLAPVLDLANHDERPSAVYAFSPARGGLVRLHAARKVAAGEEVTIRYGDFKNEHYTRHYGFVPRSNAADAVSLPLLTLLEHAHAGEEEVPLHVKLQSVLDAAVATLHSKWFTTTPDTLVKKLNTLTNAMGSSSAPY